MITDHDHLCFCGGGKKSPHQIESDGCYRFFTEPPIFSEGVTEYVYKYQRGYHQHPCGCWSRCKDSQNSLEGDW